MAYKGEASELLAFYSTAMIRMLLSAWFIVPETKYFEEEHVSIAHAKNIETKFQY